MSRQSRVTTKKSVGIAALIAAAMALIVAVAMGSSSATAAPGGGKGKPTPSVTVSTTPTPTPTVTPLPTDVRLSCAHSGEYYAVSYTSVSGTVYEGATLSNGPTVLATFGTANTTTFPTAALPPGVTVALSMVTPSGQTVAYCVVNTNIYETE